MFTIEGQPVDIPEYRDFISAGTYLLGVLIVAMVPVIAGIVKRDAKKVAKDVKQALDEHPTSNGFTKDVKDKLDGILRSQGAIHGRLDHFEKLAIGFDNRITDIEEGNDHEEAQGGAEEAPDVQEGHPGGAGGARRVGGHGHA